MTPRLSVIAAFLALVVVGAQAPSRVFVVVFDERHLSAGGLKRLQGAAVTLFKNEFESGDLGGVIVDGQLANNRLLGDPAELLQAVDRAHPRIATASDLEASAAIPGGVQPSARLAEIDSVEAARAGTDRQLSILETLVGNLARVDGAKAVLLMSDAFGGDAASARVRSIVEAAIRAGVRFHVLDESGSDRDAAGGLARGTGGTVTRKANAFAASIASIGRDTSAWAATRRTAAAPVAAPPIPAPTTLKGEDAPAAASLAAGPVAAAPVASGVIVATPSADPNVLRVRPLAETHVMDLAGGDWSDAAARAGWEAYQRGDLESARAALTPIAARPVAPSWIEYVLGQANYALGQFKDASVAWERVRQRQPAFQPVYLDLADDYVKMNERGKALSVLRTARERWPKDADILNALGVTEGGGGALDEAIKVFTQAIEVAPNETISYLNLAKSLEMRYVQKRRNLMLLGWGAGAAEERERQNALRAYERYVATNGPYVDLAREGIARLTADAPARRR